MPLTGNKLISYPCTILGLIILLKSLRTNTVEKGNCHGVLYIAYYKRN